jgi:REP element-mobilizing transposase RayT
MPRKARLDIPGTLDHVMVRGIEGSNIFRDDEDRKEFFARINFSVEKTGTRILAWAPMDNHVHLLLISGPAGLPTFMRRLLTGYAIGYNRRHRRFVHLFQNRYKSIICEQNHCVQGMARRMLPVTHALAPPNGVANAELSLRSRPIGSSPYGTKVLTARHPRLNSALDCNTQT